VLANESLLLGRQNTDSRFPQVSKSRFVRNFLVERARSDSLSGLLGRGGMSKFWKGILWALGAIWAFVAVAATVPAGTAISNLQSWADLLGLTTLAHALALKTVDYIVQIATLAMMIIAAILNFQTVRAVRVTKEEMNEAKAASERYEALKKHFEETLGKP
jgi:hypothetical protein